MMARRNSRPEPSEGDKIFTNAAAHFNVWTSIGVKGRTQVYKFFRTQIQLIKMFGELHVPSEVAIVLPRVIFVPKLSQARAKLCQIGS